MTSNVIATLESIGQQIWLRAAMGNIIAGFVLVVVLVCDRLLARRVAPAWRIALYLLVFARLLGPISWRFPMGLWRGETGPVTSMTLGALQSDFDARTFVDGVLLPPTEAHMPITWLSGITLSYAVGVLLLTALWVRGRAAVVRLAREARSQPASGQLRIAAHPAAGPVLVGLHRPLLIVPEWLLEPAQSGALAHVIAHEKAHIRRLDPWLAALLHAACVVAWPIAAAWIAASRIRGLMEQAADARAASDGAGRVGYAQTLLDVAQRASFTRITPATLAFGGDVRSRIRTLASLTAHWPRGVQLAACGLLGLSALACTTVHQPARSAQAMVGPSVGGQSMTIEATIFNCKPSHPALRWQGANVPGNSTPKVRDSVGAMNLTEAQFREIATNLNESAGQRIVSRPAVTLASFSPAAITVGEDTSGASFSYTLTLTHSPTIASPDRFIISFAWKQGDTVRPDIQDAEIELPPGGIRAFLVSSQSGREFNLMSLHRGGTTPSPALADSPSDNTVRWDVKIHRVNSSVTPKQVVMGEVRSMEGARTIAVLGNDFLTRFNSKLSTLGDHEIVAIPSVVALDRQKATVTRVADVTPSPGDYALQLTLSAGKTREYAEIVWSVDGAASNMTIAEWIDDKQSIIAIQPGADGSLYVLVATPTFRSPLPPAAAGR